MDSRIKSAISCFVLLQQQPAELQFEFWQPSVVHNSPSPQALQSFTSAQPAGAQQEFGAAQVEGQHLAGTSEHFRW